MLNRLLSHPCLCLSSVRVLDCYPDVGASVFSMIFDINKDSMFKIKQIFILQETLSMSADDVRLCHGRNRSAGVAVLKGTFREKNSLQGEESCAVYRGSFKSSDCRTKNLIL